MEFIAYGMANMLGCFFSGMIVSGSFSRSALKYEMNACTQIASAVQALICLLCLLFLMPLLSPLPKCVLASVVTISVYRLIKNGINEFKFLLNVSRIELIEFLVALIIPLCVGLELGILISIGSSIIVNLVKLQNENEYVEENEFEDTVKIPNITIIEMKAELSFTNNNRLVDKLRQLLSDGHKYIIVSLNLTSFIDTTSIRQIVTIFEDAKGSYICLSQCRPNVNKLISRYEKDVNEFPKNIKTFISTYDAVKYLQSIINNDDSDNDDDDDNMDINNTKPQKQQNTANKLPEYSTTETTKNGLAENEHFQIKLPELAEDSNGEETSDGEISHSDNDEQ